MKSNLDRLLVEDENFRRFMAHLERTANYFVATDDATRDELHAIRLCIADAYEVGKQLQPKG